jgi:tetratricopeptide (TPR) repeat protein
VRLTAGPGGGITSLLHAATAGHSVFGATADPYRTATAYSTVRALLASVLGLKAHDAADAGRELAELIATAAPGLVPWIPLIATVLDVPADTTSEVDALADEFRRPRLEASIVELLRALVAAPTFLVIDDAHLLDDASLGVVRAIEAASDTAPWLLLLGGRPTGPWLDPSTEVVALPALDETAARTLITAALGDRALTPTDTTAILRRGAGNPSFLKSLALAARSGQDVTGLPDSAEELVAAQVDALDPPVRRALRYASVLGMSFDNAELGALLGDGSTAHPRPPLPAEFISMDNGRFRFTQALVRDAAYEGLSFRVRARLHGRAAEYLAESAQDPSAISDLLSLHYAHANRPEPAWHFSLVAGDRARAKFAPAEAEVLYARALRSGRNLRSIGPIDRGNVYVKLARSQEAVGRLDSAVRSLREGRTRLRGDPLLTADAYATEASVLRQLGRFPQVMRAARSGIAALDGLADAEAEQLRSDLKMVIAGLLGWEGRVSEALDWARSAETDAAASGRPQSQAYVATTIHWCLLLLGTPDRSYGERALAWHRETGDRRHEAESLNNLALQDWQEGRGEKALESFRESAEVARAAGDEFTSTVTRANVGDVLVRLGRAEEAESLLRDVAHVQQALGAAGFEATTRRSLAIALAQLGRFAEAESILEAIQATQQELGEEDELTESRTAAAWTALLAGDPARALARCADAEARAREAEATYLLAPILRITGAALLDQGRVPEATTALTEALGRCVEARFERGFVLAELARAARAAGEEETARDWERQAETAWEEFGWTGSTRYPRGT